MAQPDPAENDFKRYSIDAGDVPAIPASWKSGSKEPPGERVPAKTATFRVIGIMRDTAEDVEFMIEAASSANARAKAAMYGVLVTGMSRQGPGASEPVPLEEPALSAPAQALPAATPQPDAPTAHPGRFPWPRVFGAISIGWGVLWVFGGTVGLLVGFSGTQGLFQWSSGFLDLLIYAFMVCYGSLAVKAGHRLGRRLGKSMQLSKFVWGIAFLIGLAYLFWPRSTSFASISLAIVLLVMGLAFPVFVFLWFSNDTVKAEVESWR